jgi:hypothetical protein
MPAKQATKQQNITGRGKPFQKGKSGNPNGRPKNVHDVQKLAKQHTKEAVERLVYWMRDTNPKASVAACMALLDRGWGKAAQVLTGEGGEGPVRATIEITIVDPA